MKHQKILLVENSKIYSSYLPELLYQLQYDVIQIGDGLDAYRWICSHEIPDLLLIDVRLPGMDGIELLKRLELKKVVAPTLLLFDELNWPHVKEITDLPSAKGGFKRPFNPSILLKKIDQIIGMGGNHKGTTHI